MVEFRRGIKAGILAGVIASLVFGIIFTFFNATVLYGTVVRMVDDNLAGIPEELPVEEMEVPSREMMITYAVYGHLLDPLFNVIPSLILGLLFALLFSKIPGDTAVKKGLFVGILIWLLIFLVNLLTFSSLYRNYFVFTNLLSFCNQFFFGYLLGRFWIKFGKNESDNREHKKKEKHPQV